MRFRDLETGTFLTRDPIGYGNGPNVYCYVNGNPITKFDAFGLADGDTVEDYEEKIADVDEDIAETYEEWNNTLVDLDNDPKGRKRDAAFVKKLSGLFDKRNDLCQSQADLKASGWSREGAKKVGPRMVNGEPKIKGDIPSKSGVEGKAYRDPTPDERKHQFTANPDGSLSAKTLEGDAKAFYATQARDLKTVDSVVTKAGIVSAGGSSLMVALPALLPAATVAGNKYLENPGPVNQALQRGAEVVNGYFNTPGVETTTAGQAGQLIYMGTEKVKERINE